MCIYNHDSISDDRTTWSHIDTDTITLLSFEVWIFFFSTFLLLSVLNEFWEHNHTKKKPIGKKEI